MREALGPYRASLTQGRRRSIIFLAIITIGITGAIAWSSFVPLQDQRRLLTRFETGNITAQNFFEFSPGVTCSGGQFGPPEPAPTSPEPSPSGTGSPPTETPPPGKPGIAPVPPGSDQSQPMCQFVSPDGTPIGPTFEGDPFEKFSRGGVSQQVIDELKPEIVKSLRGQVAILQKGLAPRVLFDGRVRAIGTFVGILFAVLFASTFVGAEIRWGVWRTLLTHEPRRGKLIASKFGALWTYVVVGLVVVLAVSTAVDVVMRNVLEVHATGGPSVLHLAKETGWAALSLGVYSTMAAALTLVVRTSLAGVASLLLLLGDHLLVTKYTWLRVFLPVQNIAWLLPQSNAVDSGYVWPSAIRIKFECAVRPAGGLLRECKDVMLKPIPHWRASLVLGAWIIGFALAAWAIFRSRDVPQ